MNDPITAEIWQRVVQLQSEGTGRPGTGFVVDGPGSRYLVTAQHLCVDAPSETFTITYAWANGTKPLTVELTRVGDPLEGGDVAAFLLSGTELDTVAMPGSVVLSSTGIGFTQECFILGFPYGLTFDLELGGIEVTLPVAKRGTIAGFTRNPKLGDGVWMLLDVVANPGFSGGPVVARVNGAWQFVGVVAGTMSGPIEEGSTERFASGLSTATDADQARRAAGLPSL
ncbi:serine protease [Cellulomonas sp. HZM]|uniref:S1 family peptidase n=1 Tax=Cellulomonas sp. HZM TaxID=1454010 RepID=UPI0004933B52|nr:serine protease [Cellulomonas sp. HZM]